jgi:anti-sigma B factor antagonist
MEIKKTIDGNTTVLKLSGRLDTITSPQLGKELDTVFEAGAINLTFDLSALDYISSSGLRVLLSAQKKINSLGTSMKITGVNETVKEIFEVTGFTGILSIE